MKPLVCTCVRERKEQIAQDVTMVLFGIEQYIKGLKQAQDTTGWKEYEEAQGRLEKIISDLPEIIEAMECVPDLITSKNPFEAAYSRAYRKLTMDSSRKAYPLRGRKGETERCEGCINPRCKRPFS